MDINELESFKMSDAVKFHKELNPQLWEDEKLDPEVRDQLLLIAEDFVEYLGISNLKVKDVTVSGSNAAYSYTPHSDLDLHILVDFNELPNNEVYQELFTAKKTLYNDAHDITVHGVPVELYVQDTNQPVQSLGEYSIVHDKWIRIPKKRRANFDQAATKAKYEKLGDLIELALKSKDPKRVVDTIALVKRYRKSGLDKHGEFGPENLAYKAVRKQGLVQDLYDLKSQLHGEKLSIEEEHKLLNKPTLTVAELAEKHGVSRMDIAKQLDKGVKVELEHTKDKSVAREIALDHLAEDPKYYDKLASVELEEQQLDETVEENQIVNVVSNIAAAQIAKVMKAKESKLLALLDGGLSPKEKLELFGVKVKDLNVPNVNDPLLKKLFNILYIKVNSQVDFYDDPSAPKTLGGYYDGDYTVELFFPAIEYVAGKRESQLKSEIASTLAHEIQHAIDDYKSDNKVYAGSNISPAKDMQGYLKLPYEVNARFQEATMDIAKYIAMPKNDGSKTTQADLPELIRYAFEKNRLDKIYEKNQKEYKRLLTRAYKFFDAEMKAPKKATPIPQNIAKRALAWILGKQTKEINEASGYIPSEKEKNDPRFKTALTVDVKPDSIKNNAKAFNWKTSRAGIPPQARPDGKIAEDLMKEWKSFLAEDQEQQELFPGYDEKHRQERLNAWLGKSQAVTATYKPKVLYHATTKHFDQFRAQNKGFASALGMTFEVDRSGIFLAENPKFAAEYIEDEYGAYKENAVIIPVYLSAQYTFVLTDSGLSPMLNDEALVEEFKEHDIDLRSIYYHIYEDQRWELFDGPEGEEFVRNLKKLGYDSAYMYEDSRHLGRNGVWVAFEPSQVKAITNRGSFSPDDPRLMKESSTVDTAYHVSKASNRDSIMTGGLTPRNQEDLNIHRKPGVYFFKSLDDAKEWAHWGKLTYNEPYDIWKVDLPKTHQIAKDTHPEMRDFSSYVTYESIPPENIDLV